LALRLLEIMMPSRKEEEATDLLEEFAYYGLWRDPIRDEEVRIQMLLEASAAESVADRLEKRFATLEGFRLIVLAVEAAAPRPEIPEPEPAPLPEEKVPPKPAKVSVGRIYREELYADVTDVASFNGVYAVMVILSSVVCAIGLLRENTAVIIGAMVIAPLLGPNVALALATTLADRPLAKKSLFALAAGVAIAFIMAFILGKIITVDPNVGEIAARTRTDIGDILLALASGIAGALAFTQGAPAALVGVMVAVALLPPIISAGILFGGGHLHQAAGALMLFFVNMASVNFAGVATFLIQGVKPLSWGDATKARWAARVAIWLWAVLLIGLAIRMMLGSR